MIDFLQGVLITFAIIFPMYLMSNGFSLTPKTTSTPAMDTSMPGMGPGTGAATTPSPTSPTPAAHAH